MLRSDTATQKLSKNQMLQKAETLIVTDTSQKKEKKLRDISKQGTQEYNF